MSSIRITARLEWIKADAEASAAEAALSDEWKMFEAGLGPVPPPERLQEVSALRAIATEKLNHTLKLMDAEIWRQNRNSGQ